MILPNAPLIEVVFELHWRAVKADKQHNFGYDPNFVPFLEAFTAGALDIGFDAPDLSGHQGPTLVHSVNTRFRQGNKPFPLIQLGHGLFACNVSTDYTWPSFKRLIVQGVENVFAAYPDNKLSPFIACRLELRYVDVFNKSLLGHDSVEKFLKEHSKFKHDGLSFFESEPFEGPAAGMMVLGYPLRDSSLGRFEFMVASGVADGNAGIILTSKVINDDPHKIALGSGADRVGRIERWVEAAHGVTSPFFKEFIDEDLMAAFKKP